MSKFWNVQPILPPPSPEEYMKLYAGIDRAAVGTAVPAGQGIPKPYTPMVTTAYSIYLTDMESYVGALQRQKDDLHTTSLLKKVLQQELSVDKPATEAYFKMTPDQTVPYKAISDVLYPDEGATKSASTILKYKMRTKQTPPAAKAEIVAAKTVLRTNKVAAKAAAISRRAQDVSTASSVKDVRADAKRTYSSVLASGRKDNSELAAKTVASTQYSRVLSKLDKTESKRVPLYNKNGGHARMPAQPTGTFLEAAPNVGKSKNTSSTTRTEGGTVTVTTQEYIERA